MSRSSAKYNARQVETRRTAASGIMAMKLKLKRRAASQFNLWEMMLRGTKTRRMLRYEPKMKNLYECHHDG